MSEFMAGSVAYARMKRALLALVNLIPKGKVAEISALAEALNIPPRHAAFILSQLGEEEREATFWYRAVPKGAKFEKSRQKNEKIREQMRRLEREGLTFGDGGEIEGWPGPSWTHPDAHRSTFWADLGDDDEACRFPLNGC